MCKSCGYPMTKSSNWICVVEHPYDAHRLHDKWACREPITINNFDIDMFINHAIPDSKCFHWWQTAPQAPPVGSYDVKNRKQGLAPGFGKGKRFTELKGECNRVNFACHLGQLLLVMCPWPLRTANLWPIKPRQSSQKLTVLVWEPNGK